MSVEPTVVFPGLSGNYLDTPDINLLDADTAHIVQSIGGWANWYQAASPRVFADVSSPFGGSSLAWDSGQADDRSDIQAGDAPASVSASTVYTVSAWVKTPITTDCRVDAYSDGDNVIATDVEVTADTWTQLSTQITTSAGATTVWPIVRMNSLSRTVPAGTTYQLAAVQVAAGSDPTFYPSLRIVGDLDMRILLSADNWDKAGTQTVLGNTGWSDYDGFTMYLRDTGNVELRYADGTTARPFAYLHGFTDGVAHEVGGRFTVSSGEWVVSVDGIDVANSGLLNTNPGSPSGLDLGVGANPRISLVNMFQGDVYWAEVRDGIDGPIVARMFRLDLALPIGPIADGYTWTDAETGREWTSHGADMWMWSDPVIQILGNNPQYHRLGSAYVDAGVKATDAYGDDITGDVVTVNNVDPNTEGVYTVEYTVTDQVGVTVTEIRYVQVSEDFQYKVVFDGSSWADTPDVNLGDADTMHIVQSVGGWSNWYQAASPRVLADTSSPFGGSSLAWDSNAADDRSEVQAGSAPVSCSPSTVYTASVWVKTPTTTDFRLDVYSDGDNQLGTDVEITADVWTQLTTEITTSAAATEIHPIVRANSLSRVIPSGTTYQLAAVMFAAGTETTFVPSLRIVGDLDMRTQLAAADYSPLSPQYVLTIRAANFGYFIYLTDAGDVAVGYGDGTTSRLATSSNYTIPDGEAGEVRAVFDSSAGTWTYYQDGSSIDTDTGLSTNAGAASALPLTIGASATGGNEFDGDMQYAGVRDGIMGPAVAFFNANDLFDEGVVNPDGTIDDGAQWVDSTGRIWTAHGNLTLEPDHGLGATMGMIYIPARRNAITDGAYFERGITIMRPRAHR